MPSVDDNSLERRGNQQARHAAATSDVRTGRLPMRGRRAALCVLSMAGLALYGVMRMPSDGHLVLDKDESAEAARSVEALAELCRAAREGREEACGRGPRPPENERERRLAVIPEYDPEEDLLFFSHIHKTSGTSLSYLLSDLFPRSSIVPSSHPSKGLEVGTLTGHDAQWWEPYKVMYSHNRPNITDTIGVPPTKKRKLLVTVRNPLLHMASTFFEAVCRFGLHIKDGQIDVEEATLTRLKGGEVFSFCRDAEQWIRSPMFFRVYRNMQANWLSYGSVARHPCIERKYDLNSWYMKEMSVNNDLGDGAALTRIDCNALQKEGLDAEIWEDYFNRTAEAAVRRLEGATWIGVTERMDKAVCLLFLTLGEKAAPLGNHRHKEPRPITVWSEGAIAAAAEADQADWRVYEAANDILDLRLWTARERLKNASEEERQRLGYCFDVLMDDA